MAVPKKKERNKIGFWTDEEILKQFDAFCEKSKIIKSYMDWEKFRNFDKKGRFNLYNNSYLSVMLVKRKRVLKGICVLCGKKKAIKNKVKCQSCWDKSREKYLESHPI